MATIQTPKSHSTFTCPDLVSVLLDYVHNSPAVGTATSAARTAGATSAAVRTAVAAGAGGAATDGGILSVVFEILNSLLIDWPVDDSLLCFSKLFATKKLIEICESHAVSKTTLRLITTILSHLFQRAFQK